MKSPLPDGGINQNFINWDRTAIDHCRITDSGNKSPAPGEGCSGG